MTHEAVHDVAARDTCVIVLQLHGKRGHARGHDKVSFRRPVVKILSWAIDHLYLTLIILGKILAVATS